jgi:phosphohistidine phosphatase SixA/8-oxo-dGTP pyrophosphatase MutT (NUDIX family)
VTASDKHTIQAAGVVLHGAHDDVVIVHRPHREDWSLPKGKLESNESHLLAAVRECWEETGYVPVIGAPLAERRYLVAGVEKHVLNWRATVGSGHFTPNSEVDQVQWVPAAKAPEFLSYPSDAELVKQSVAVGTTWPLVVLRHADATKRVAWQAAGSDLASDDLGRPLSPEGLVQSDQIAQFLAAYGITHVLTSDSRRCRQTVEPYAATAGIRIERQHLLSEEGWTDDPEGTERVVRDLLDRVPAPTVLCTHRPVLHLVLSTIENVLEIAPGEAVSAQLDPRLAAGDMLVLHRNKVGAVIVVERHGIQT